MQNISSDGQGRNYIWDVDHVSGYANAMGSYKTGLELAFVLKHLTGDQMEILDVGGGSGRFAIPLADRGHRVTVVDVSTEAIDMLLRRNHPNIKAICGDFYSLQIPRKFDAVIAIESVQYFREVALIDLFSKTRSLLRPEAPFIFTELNNRSWRYILRSLTPSRKHLYNVTGPSGYLAVLEKAGLTVTEMNGFVWMPFTVDSNSRLVPAFALIERALYLRKWIGQSPWLLISAIPTCD